MVGLLSRLRAYDPEAEGVCSIAAAIIIPAVVGAGASVIGAGKAAGAQKDAAQQATNAQLQMYNTTRGDLLPYNTAGQSVLPTIQNMLTGSPQQIQAQLSQLPGYQFNLTQGLKSVQNAAAARGLGSSGAALKGAATYATGLANSTYGDQINRLMGLANLGESAGAQTGAYGTATGTNIGNNITGAGNAQGAAYIAGANGISNAANQIGGLYTTNQLLKSGGYPGLFGGGGGGAQTYPASTVPMPSY